MLAALPRFLNVELGSGSTAYNLERYFSPGHASFVFRYTCKMGLEGIVSEAAGLALPIWAFSRLVEV
jgi:hypothetical protein